MILKFDGIKNSLMLHTTNKSMSKSSLLESILPNKYLSSLNMK